MQKVCYYICRKYGGIMAGLKKDNNVYRFKFGINNLDKIVVARRNEIKTVEKTAQVGNTKIKNSFKNSEYNTFKDEDLFNTL